MFIIPSGTITKAGFSFASSSPSSDGFFREPHILKHLKIYTIYPHMRYEIANSESGRKHQKPQEKKAGEELT